MSREKVSGLKTAVSSRSGQAVAIEPLPTEYTSRLSVLSVRIGEPPR